LCKELGIVVWARILRKFGSYPRQNGLALALGELGHIERTLFMLEWLQNPALRRRVKAGLNKAEAKNALARAVSFNRFENQALSSAGLTSRLPPSSPRTRFYLEPRLSRVLARAGERGELFKPLVLQGYLLRLVLSSFPDQSIDVLGDFLNLPPRRLVVDRLFHSLISLFGREEHDRLMRITPVPATASEMAAAFELSGTSKMR